MGRPCGRSMVLPYRRYSVPETVMRKYARRYENDYKLIDKSVQTSPITGNDSNKVRLKNKGRSKSWDGVVCSGSVKSDLSKSHSCPNSICDQGTPSPSLWTPPSSSDNYTNQTVTDRTTSTQDSTLSVPSTTAAVSPNSSEKHIMTVDTGINTEPQDSLENKITLEACVQTSLEKILNSKSNSDKSRKSFSSSSQLVESTEDESTGEQSSSATETFSIKLTSTTNISKGEIKNKDYLEDFEKLKQSNRERQNKIEQDMFGQKVVNTDIKNGNKTYLFSDTEKYVDKVYETEEVILRDFENKLSEATCVVRNYSDYPSINMIIPRYSAVPRTGSMLVNTSSNDYSSDSDLSLTDSLEDGVENVKGNFWPSSRHDNRLVRGEVVTASSQRKRPVKSSNTHAYFLFLSGEEDTIKHYTVPERLKERLREKEDEIKKIFGIKLSTEQKQSFRRKRKPIKALPLNDYSSSDNNKQNNKVKVVSISTQCDQTENLSVNNKDAKKSKFKKDAEIAKVLIRAMNENIKNNSSSSEKNILKKEELDLNLKNDLKQDKSNTKEKSQLKSNLLTNEMKTNILENSSKLEKVVLENVTTSKNKCNKNLDKSCSPVFNTVPAYSQTSKKHLKEVTMLNNEIPPMNFPDKTESIAQTIILNGNSESITENSSSESISSSLYHKNEDKEKTVFLATVKLTSSSQTEDVSFNNGYKLLADDNLEKIDIANYSNKKDANLNSNINENNVDYGKISPNESKFIDDIKNQSSANLEEANKNFITLGTQTDSHDLIDLLIKKLNVKSNNGEIIKENSENTLVEKTLMISSKYVSNNENLHNINKIKSVKTQTILEFEDFTNELVLKEKILEVNRSSINIDVNQINETLTNSNQSIIKKREIFDENNEFNLTSRLNQQINSDLSAESNFKLSDIKGNLNKRGIDYSKTEKFINPAEKTMESTNSSNLIAYNDSDPNLDNWEDNNKNSDYNRNVKNFKNENNSVNGFEDSINKKPQLNTKLTNLENPEHFSNKYLFETNNSSNFSFKKSEEINKGYCKLEDKCSSPIVNTVTAAVQTNNEDVKCIRNVNFIFEETSDKLKYQPFENISEESSKSSLSIPEIEIFDDETDKSDSNENLNKFWPKSLKDREVINKNTQILEINDNPCECHLCVREKKILGLHENISGNRSRQFNRRLQYKYRNSPNKNMVKPIYKKNLNLSSKFAKFEAIPEERNSSIESPKEENNNVTSKPTSGISRVTDELSNLGKKLINNDQSDKKKKGGFVVGKFRPVKDDSEMPKDDLKISKKSKEDILTLSKGWINFYLVPETADEVTLENDDESCILQESVEQYSIEIRATPEPAIYPKIVEQKSTQTHKEIILPTLSNKKEISKLLKSSGSDSQVSLPEIKSSNSSNTTSPEEMFNKSTKLEKSLNSLPELTANKTELKITRNNSKKKQMKQILHSSEQNSTSRAVEVTHSEHSSSLTSSTVMMSESPQPKFLKIPEKKMYRRHKSEQMPQNSSWTVTVAGSSGTVHQPPPDVEMRLTFANHRNDRKMLHAHERNYYSKYNARHVKNKRQSITTLEEKHERRSKQALCYIPDDEIDPKTKREKQIKEKISFIGSEAALREAILLKQNLKRTKSSLKDYSEISLESARSEKTLNSTVSSLDDLQVMGMSIMPEQKPYVPTQSERDLVRSHRYKFTR